MEHARSRLPVLDGLAREVIPRRAARSFLVTHVLGTSVPYLDIINRIFPIEAVLAIHVLNQGTPVNFRDGSILGPVLDLIYSELFVAMRTLVAGRGVPGLSMTGDDIHQEVSRAWLNTYVSRFACASALTGEALPA